MLLLKRTVITIVACLLAFNIIAQDDDYKKYLDDGKVSTPSNAFKFDISGVFAGDLGFNYERKITRWLSIELGAFAMPYSLFRKDLNLFFLSDVLRLEFGRYGYSLQPRFYFFKGAINFRAYASYAYRVRYYQFSTSLLGSGRRAVGDIPVIEQAIHLGYQLQKGKRIVWDVSFGISQYHFDIKDTGMTTFYNSDLHLSNISEYFFTSRIKLGIFF